MATRARTPSAISPKPALKDGAIATDCGADRLKLPRLEALGLGHAMKASTGRAPPGFALAKPRGQWGYGIETSRGKDTPSGHWELAGTPVDFDWGYFPETIPAFPATLTEALIAQGKLAGILANRHASGIAVIEDYGEEHLRTLKPICYTSAELGAPDRRARRGFRPRAAL